MRQKKSVNGKGNVIMNQNRREGDNIKKSDTLSKGATVCSSWEEVNVNAVTGQLRGRGRAAAKYEPLQCFPRAKTHFSHTVRDVVQGKTCPNSVYTPVPLSPTESSPLHVLHAAIRLHGVSRGQEEAQTQNRLFGNIFLTGVRGHQAFRRATPSLHIA